MGKGRSLQREALKLNGMRDIEITPRQRREAFSCSYFAFDEFKARACKGNAKQAELLLDQLVEEGLLQKAETITYTHTKDKITKARSLNYRYTPDGARAYKEQLAVEYMDEFEGFSLEAKDIVRFLHQTDITQPNQLDMAQALGLSRKQVSKAVLKLMNHNFISKVAGVSSTAYYYNNGNPTYYLLSHRGSVVARRMEPGAKSIWQDLAQI